MFQLRPFQSNLIDAIYSEWSKVQNVVAVAATGSGKTVIFSTIVAQHDCPTCVIAHRQELVNQISLALARNGVRHKILAGKSTIQDCVAIHMRELGRSFYDANSRAAVAGVHTITRMNQSDPWFKAVGLWVMDEAHHTLRRNIWGKAVAMFPNAKGLGVTATPVRADGFGLGRHADGVFDSMVLAPTMREIINMGFLTDYRIFAPPTDIDLSNVGTSAGGDYSPEPLRAAVHKSRVVGDAAQSYLKIAPGKIGITFCVDVESATEQAAAYRHYGVPAEVISATTPSMVRSSILRRLAAGEVKQVTNVDLFGEGFDAPAIEVVSMARPSQSRGLIDQQFGRALRLKDGKEYGLIIDHVGNTAARGWLPDAPRIWTLDRREKRASGKSDAIPMRVCPDCSGAYERAIGPTCPYCGQTVAPQDRRSIEAVDGDLHELDPDVLRKLRGEIDKPPTFPLGARPEIVGAINKRHREKCETIEYLRQVMMHWAAGKTDIPRAQREFYLTFNIDILTAQTLNKADALKLIERIYESF